MKKTTIYLLLFFTLAMASQQSTYAAISEAEQSQAQKGEIECETITVVGPYGQTTTRCKTKLEQEQTQKIVYIDKEVEPEKVHEPVDTGIDQKTVVAAMSTIITGSGAFLIKLKQKFQV